MHRPVDASGGEVAGARNIDVHAAAYVAKLRVARAGDVGAHASGMTGSHTAGTGDLELQLSGHVRDRDLARSAQRNTGLADPSDGGVRCDRFQAYRAIGVADGRISD